MNELKEEDKIKLMNDVADVLEKLLTNLITHREDNSLADLMQLIETYTAKKELEARIDGRRIQAQATLDKWNETDPSAEYTFGTFLAAQVDGFVYELTQLSSQLTNKEEV